MQNYIKNSGLKYLSLLLKSITRALIPIVVKHHIKPNIVTNWTCPLSKC